MAFHVKESGAPPTNPLPSDFQRESGRAAGLRPPDGET